MMKKRLLWMMAVILTLCGATVTSRAQVTQLSIEKLSGAEEVSALAAIGKIVFDKEGLCLYDKAGTELGRTPFNQIGKIVFSAGPGTNVGDVERPAIQVSFDQETLFIRGFEGRQTVRIFNMKGQMLLSAVSSDSEARLYVSGLQKDVYLLQVGAQVVKFIKK